LFMVDEVQTGNGRSGYLYAYEHFGLKPDVVTTAKGLAGGLPLGVCMMASNVEDVLQKGEHGSTFGANPVCCAAAVSILSRIDDKLLEEVRQKAQLVKDELTGCPGIEDVCGLGLMIGIKTTKPASEVAKACLEAGVLVLTAKDKVRLLPALNIPFDLLKRSLEIIKGVCA
ncbi:MAG: aminotransferase class III-fold pyridoxal phosphate-dependent enzyme, partial [Eggerthellaceae bacterium]|nr:aminotransferase class III-fold pyridoxal phosphate-dependent enzyme [Eggerthellaceae bacterium]